MCLQFLCVALAWSGDKPFIVVIDAGHGGTAGKKEELFHTLDLFRAPEPVEEEDEEFLPEDDDDDFEIFDYDD